MESVCRIVQNHWCTECCEGRNCNNFNTLRDGSWGCVSHSNKPEYCNEADCIEDNKITKDEAINIIKSLPNGEFFASIALKNKN